MSGLRCVGFGVWQDFNSAVGNSGIFGDGAIARGEALVGFEVGIGPWTKRATIHAHGLEATKHAKRGFSECIPIACTNFRRYLQLPLP